MGQAVANADKPRFEIKSQVSLKHPDYDSLGQCDAVIDFSAGPALMAALPHLGERTVLVSGTTGLSKAEEDAVRAASSRLPILRSGNFSLGITVLMALAEKTAATLGDDWDIEILEMHHRHKVDAPSGTALMLGEAVAKGRDVSLAATAVHDRTGQRKDGDIGFAVLRGGGVYGWHEVRLASPSEMITLGHQALNREVFAHGALAAADWLIGRKPGLYTLLDMITL
jgi:4-hydroxy-tetrahydrodipicolinate reductase